MLNTLFVCQRSLFSFLCWDFLGGFPPLTLILLLSLACCLFSFLLWILDKVEEVDGRGLNELRLLFFLVDFLFSFKEWFLILFPNGFFFKFILDIFLCSFLSSIRCSFSGSDFGFFLPSDFFIEFCCLNSLFVSTLLFLGGFLSLLDSTVALSFNGSSISGTWKNSS